MTRKKFKFGWVRLGSEVRLTDYSPNSRVGICPGDRLKFFSPIRCDGCCGSTGCEAQLSPDGPASQRRVTSSPTLKTKAATKTSTKVNGKKLPLIYGRSGAEKRVGDKQLAGKSLGVRMREIA